jgi:L-asparagine oxygenase
MSLSEKLTECGWARLDIEPGKSLLEFATELGAPIPDPSGSMNRFLIAKHQSNARRNTTSSIYGLDNFPLHTDYAHLATPPRYLLLRSHFGRSATTTSILNPLNAFGRTWLDYLKRATWRISSGFSSRAGIMHLPGTSHGFRWDPYLMRPLNKFAMSASIDLKYLFQNCTSAYIHAWEHSQEVLLIDNWHVLHGRGAAAEFDHRCIERVFLQEINRD